MQIFGAKRKLTGKKHDEYQYFRNPHGPSGSARETEPLPLCESEQEGFEGIRDGSDLHGGHPLLFRENERVLEIND